MNKNETRGYVERHLAEKIRYKMGCIEDLLADTSDEKFAIISEVSLLITKLLSNEDTKKKFIELANRSTVNGEDNDVKFRTFEIIRNIVSHFPFFETWDEVFITNNLLNWNGKNYDGIKKYFRENCDKTLKYIIYTKQFGKWEPAHTVTMKVLPIDDEKKVYMKNMITEDDVIWTFSLIDYYLDYMGFELKTYSWASL